MKKIIFGILAIAIISCNNSKPVDYALFSGIIKNANSENLTIFNGSYKAVRKIKISDTGAFSDTIINANGYYSFNDGKESSAIYLKDGYNIQLNMDAKEFDETIVYTGNNSDVNNFLAKKFLIKEESGTRQEVYSLDETAYLAEINEQKESLEKALEGLDSDFVKQEKINIKYDYISHVKNYQSAHSYYLKKKDFEVSESFPDVLKGIEFDNEEHFKSSAAYKGIVINNFSKVAKEKAKKEKISFEIACINLIKESKNETMNNGFLTALSNRVSSRNPNAKELYNNIMELSTDEDLKKQLTKQYNDIQKLAKGSISPVFVDYENNAGGTTSLTDLKGKYVYIDVWATWCGPCKKEIPFLKEVEKAYHNKNIEFVSVSVDKAKDHIKWKQMIVDKELGGIQLFADKNFESDFIKDYAISGIPRFILIGPNGNIVSSDAPRPSDEKLKSLFNELKI